MTYYVGDIPVQDIVIEPAHADETPIDLDPFESAAEVTLTSPTASIPTTDFLATVDPDAGHVVVEWPNNVELDEPGVWTLSLTLVTTDDRRQRLAPIYLIVQDDNGWYTLDQARIDWTDAPSDDARLFQLLGLAREQVEAYAPTLAAGAAVPERYKGGQLMQARNLWNSGQADPGTGGVGDDNSFTLTVHPLDWMVQQVLRPKTKPVAR
jgi:hypothetical protein